MTDSERTTTFSESTRSTRHAYSIPEFNVYYLIHLSCSSLQGNGITGEIPKEFGNLTSLTMLDLENNHLTGQIPSSLGNLKNLQFLWVTISILLALPLEFLLIVFICLSQKLILFVMQLGFWIKTILLGQSLSHLQIFQAWLTCK